MNQIIKIGIVGVMRGDFAANAVLQMQDEAEIVAFCDKNEKELNHRRKKFPNAKFFTDFDEFLETEMDAVVLCNYFHEHAELAMKAMNKGVAVLSETTAAPSLGACLDLVECAERNNAKYMLAVNCIYFKAFTDMRKRIASKEYGNVVFADAEYSHAASWDWTAKKVDVENITHWRQIMPACYYNMHTLGPLMFLTGTMPKKVIGKAVRGIRNSHATDTIKSFSLIEMDDGSVFNTTGCDACGTTGRWFRVACECGNFETKRDDETPTSFIETGHRYNDQRILFPDWDYPEDATYEDKYFINKKAESSGHGGIDFFVVYHFLRYLRGEEDAYFDVYRATALSAAGILSWCSTIENSVQLDIPDFKDKIAREKVRGDYRTPIGMNSSERSLPYAIGDVQPSVSTEMSDAKRTKGSTTSL